MCHHLFMHFFFPPSFQIFTKSFPKKNLSLIETLPHDGDLENSMIDSPATFEEGDDEVDEEKEVAEEFTMSRSEREFELEDETT